MDIISTYCNNIGIVLKINYFNGVIDLFDRNLGKLKVFKILNKDIVKTNEMCLCNGALIDYSIIKGKTIRVSKFNIIDVPFFIALKDILFFHHVLELCYYFIPNDLENRELFNLIYFTLFSFDKFLNLKAQKIFLIKFFLLIGLYPEETEEMKTFFYYIMTIPIDRIVDPAIDLRNEKEIDIWILKCMSMNPYFKLFRTVGFLKRL